MFFILMFCFIMIHESLLSMSNYQAQKLAYLLEAEMNVTLSEYAKAINQLNGKYESLVQLFNKNFLQINNKFNSTADLIEQILQNSTPGQN